MALLSRSRRIVASVAAILLTCLEAKDASANGRFPAAQLVQLSPDGQSVALRLTFGFAISDDRGQSWHWLCEDLLNYGTGAFDPAFTLDASRRLFVGAPDGLARVARDRCSHERITNLEREFVIDLDRSRDGRTVLAITSSGADGARNRVWRSEDGGESFTALGAGFGPETLFETVEVARSNTQRVYATAVRNSPRRVVFFRSDDGGATMRESSLDMFGVDDAFVAGVDGTNPDVVYVRARLAGSASLDAGAAASPTLLLRTSDGGASFREIARSTGAMNGFALSDDGLTVWYGTTHPDDGLRRSVSGAPFERVNDARITGLRFHEGTLWVAANWVLDSFALAKSTDGGRTLEPVLRSFCELRGAPTCGPSTDVTALCGARWTVYRASTLACPVSSPDASIEPSPTMDASVEPPVSTPGCRCALVADRRPSSAMLSLFAVAAIVGARARRGRCQRPAGRCA
ncbi:MAG: hypothetical protein JNK05_20465 [Myxococcales bacterium]|nr:hypothetical protein [Myxococcales bacterium]